jgi:hypothetical protein
MLGRERASIDVSTEERMVGGKAAGTLIVASGTTGTKRATVTMCAEARKASYASVLMREGLGVKQPGWRGRHVDASASVRQMKMTAHASNSHRFQAMHHDHFEECQWGKEFVAQGRQLHSTNDSSI